MINDSSKQINITAIDLISGKVQKLKYVNQGLLEEVTRMLEDLV